MLLDDPASMPFGISDDSIEFSVFLDEIRDIYEALKRDDDIIIEPTGITVPDVNPLCPDDVKMLATTLRSFNDLLEDCLSYSAWLNAFNMGECSALAF